MRFTKNSGAGGASTQVERNRGGRSSRSTAAEGVVLSGAAADTGRSRRGATQLAPALLETAMQQQMPQS